MNKKSKLVSVANAHFKHDKSASVELSVLAIGFACDAVKDSNGKFDQIVISKPKSKDYFYKQDTLAVENAQALIDCYNSLAKLNFADSFKKHFKQRMPDDSAIIPDRLIVGGIQDIAMLLADDCQAMLPAIVNKHSGKINTGRGDDGKQLRVASFAMAHYQLVRAGCSTVLSEQAIALLEEAQAFRKDSKSLSEMLNNLYEKTRFILPLEQVHMNVLTYSFHVAFDIISTRFSKTFETGNDPASRANFAKTSQLLKACLDSDVDSEESIYATNAINACRVRVFENRLELIENKFRDLHSVARTNKWSKQDENTAILLMFEIASEFLQKHYDNLVSGKYANHILDNAIKS